MKRSYKLQIISLNSTDKLYVFNCEYWINKKRTCVLESKLCEGYLDCNVCLNSIGASAHIKKIENKDKKWAVQNLQSNIAIDKIVAKAIIDEI